VTRINLVPADILSDQHLMAEYRELPMVAAALKRSLASKRGLPPIPKTFTLNKGHVTFFYNKGKFLRLRYDELIDELKRRGFELDPNRKCSFEVFEKNAGLNNDYIPTDDEIEISIERINKRINEKRHWYKYYGKAIFKRHKVYSRDSISTLREISEHMLQEKKYVSICYSCPANISRDNRGRGNVRHPDDPTEKSNWCNLWCSTNSEEFITTYSIPLEAALFSLKKKVDKIG